jgi:SMC interacting uncharacterized protein involved in chromosome segregation
MLQKQMAENDNANKAEKEALQKQLASFEGTLRNELSQLTGVLQAASAGAQNNLDRLASEKETLQKQVISLQGQHLTKRCSQWLARQEVR